MTCWIGLPPTPSADRRYLAKSATLYCIANVAKGFATSRRSRRREQVSSIQYVVNGFAKIQHFHLQLASVCFVINVGPVRQSTTGRQWQSHGKYNIVLWAFRCIQVAIRLWTLAGMVCLLLQTNSNDEEWVGLMTLHIHPHDDAWLTLFIITRGESSDRWDLFYKNAQTQEINGKGCEFGKWKQRGRMDWSPFDSMYLLLFAPLIWPVINGMAKERKGKGRTTSLRSSGGDNETWFAN